ncbi:hypothetical protein BGZ76_001692 [Entomortierella beljakovae]|nr:hypothetical protein BGZ76_001692 [Entomortierella beljakovae]
MILSKCRLNSLPLQATPSVTVMSEQVSLFYDDDETESVDDSVDMKESNDGPATLESNSLAPNCYVDGRSTPASEQRSLCPSQASAFDDDESFNDQESTDDDEAELRAEALMADIQFPQSPSVKHPIRTSLFSDSGDHSFSSFLPQRHSSMRQIRQSSSSFGSRISLEGQANDQSALNQQELKKLKYYSSLHKSDQNNDCYRSSSIRKSRDSSSCRLSQISGWSAYRNRQMSNNARQMVREVLEHGGKLADSLGDEEYSNCEAKKEECSAWKACFGLFWFDAGHWLDDSRRIESYNLQPHTILELQLRNNYVPLPPLNTELGYFDHYAEGVLYKLSKKNCKVSNLSSDCFRDSTGTWKARWVVLQGNRLYIYHKRKDTTQKFIELLPPLNITTSYLPHNPRNSFRLSSSPSSISSATVTITFTHDPSIPSICFRATSESELNQWIRIFCSLNYAPLKGIPPPLFPNSFIHSPAMRSTNAPPPLPPLPLNLPPAASSLPPPLPIKRRQRHQSYISTPSRSNSTNAGVGEFGMSYPTERKRNHTIQCTSAVSVSKPHPLPSINPVLISNAAVAFSNLNQGPEIALGNNGNEYASSGCVKRGRSKSMRAAEQTPIKRDRNRTFSHASVSTLVGSTVNDLNQIPLSRSGSVTSGLLLKFSNGIQLQDECKDISRDLEAMDGQDQSDRLRVKSMSSNRSSQQTLLKEYIKRSKDNFTDATTLPEASSPTTMETPLEPECQELLKSSAERSSDPELYSGYIWLYVPNDQQIAPLCSKSTSPNADYSSNSSTISSVPMSKSSSNSSVALLSTPTIPKTPNICITKASGRYVKCFVVINSLGQFQWVEVGSDLDQSSEETPAKRCYGIQLNPRPLIASPKPVDTPRFEKRGSSSDMSMPVMPVKGQVQVSMAHKLRLYFFCIKVSISALSEVMIEMVEEVDADIKPLSRASSFSSSRNSGFGTTTLNAPPPQLGKKSPLRLKHRLSDPSCHQRSSSSLGVVSLPVRSVSLQKSRARSKTSTYSNTLIKNCSTALWPSMSRLHDRSPTTPVQKAVTITTPDRERAISKTFSALTPTKSILSDIDLTDRSPEVSEKISKRLLAKTQSLFMENRTISLTPSSSESQRSTGGSHASLQPNTSAAITSRHESLARALGKPFGTMYPSTCESSDSTDSSTNQSEEQSENGRKSRSQVLLLAQDLKKVLGNGRTSTDNTVSENKSTLFEITSKKRALSQKLKDSANVEAAKLKLIGGKLELPEEIKEEDEEQTLAREREREQERLLRQAVGKVMLLCPFFEKSETCVDIDGRRFVTLKGYTETEEAWRTLRDALDQFLDGPIKDQRSALPPEDTLIPSYHAPRLPEMKLSEKAQNFLKAKDRAAAAATAAGLLRDGHEPIPITAIAAAIASVAVTAVGTDVPPPALTKARGPLGRTNTIVSNTASPPAGGNIVTTCRTRRSTTLGVLGKHTVSLAHGVGYGPRKSFIEINENTNKPPARLPRSESRPKSISLKKNPIELAMLASQGRFRVESESGLRLSSATPNELVHKRSGSGNMLKVHRCQTLNPGVNEHLKVAGSGLSRWVHLPGADNSSSINKTRSIGLVSGYCEAESGLLGMKDRAYHSSSFTRIKF